MRNKNLKIIIVLTISFLLMKLSTLIFFNQNNPKINPFILVDAKKYFNQAFTTFKKTLANKKSKPPSITPSPIFFPSPSIIITSTITPNKQPTEFDPKKISPYLSPTKTPIPTPTKIPTKTPTPSASQTLSSSKLGIFVLVNYTEGAEKILNSGPRIIKFIDPQYQPVLMEAIKKYKKNYPQGIVILRFWQGTPGLKYELNNDPIRSADDFFAKVNQPAFNALGNNISYFDYLQTPNEFETTPEWWGKEKTIWNGKFWKRLTELNKNAGIKTCIGGIPVGNVEATDLGYIIEDLRAIKNWGGAFCYHSYTFDYSTDVNREIQLSLRYRQFYQFFQNNAPDLMNMPLILSEGGVAENGNPKAGYLISRSNERYKSWLTWFDNEIKKDPYVLGVTLFQIGNNSDWAYFNLESIADWLADYLRK